jgi:hypothetical protein
MSTGKLMADAGRISQRHVEHSEVPPTALPLFFVVSAALLSPLLYDLLQLLRRLLRG